MEEQHDAAAMCRDKLATFAFGRKLPIGSVFFEPTEWPLLGEVAAAFTKNDWIDYLEISSTQVDRNHPAKYA